MDYWEFLIQQEGDQTWLPLETKQVEILEGRYRIAAHTSRVNTPIEIRVSHLVLDELPPRRRVRKRKGRTNDTGLVIIFPFMQLKPGQWEVRCSGDDVMSDLLGAGWQRVVQLQVLPKAEDDWDPDWSARAEDGIQADNLTMPEALVSSDLPSVAEPPEAPASSKDLTDNQVDDIQQQSSISPLANATPATPGSPPPEVAADSDYRVQLGQQAYVIPKGQPLILSGKILREIGTHSTESELSIQLRDPQTAKVLFETRQHLATQELPALFNVELPQLSNLKTQVILGAVTLRPKGSGSHDPVLALSAFTITAGLDQLLDAIANQDTPDFEEEISIYPGTTEPFVKPAESFSTLISPDLPLAPPTVRSLTPSLGMTLPPQLYEPDAEAHPPERAPQLPLIPAQKPASPSPIADADAMSDPGSAETETVAAVASGSQAGTAGKSVRVPALFESESVEEDDLEAELAAAALDDDLDDLDDLSDLDDLEVSSARGATAPLAEEASAEDVDESAVEYTALYEAVVADMVSVSVPEVPLELEPDPEFIQIDESFQSLNLRERFWNKLTALTYEGYRAATELKSAMQAAGVKAPGQTSDSYDASQNPELDNPELSAPQPSPAPAESSPPAHVAPTNYEVVVYDTPTPEQETRAAQSQKSRQPTKLPPAEISPPILELPGHELTGGELIAVRIRLEQPQDYRPYVKVWMNDLQTRTLIDEPRLLMHFTPNQLGELETLMRVKIPLGCLELQFAAITVNMATLQESPKFVVNRHVMPPDLPSLSLDEFDL